MIVGGRLISHIYIAKELHSYNCIHEHEKEQKKTQTSHWWSSFSQRFQNHLEFLCIVDNFQNSRNLERSDNSLLESSNFKGAYDSSLSNTRFIIHGYSNNHHNKC